jgi:glycosyltransferase involved in cell wall biosynthesis
MMNNSRTPLLIVMPSLRISGGVEVILALAKDLQSKGLKVRVVSLWKTEHELSHRGVPVDYLSDFVANKSKAALQYPILLLKFRSYLRKAGISTRTPVMMTHFSTFPFGWLVPSSRWYCFNQDIEWMFVPEGVQRRLLRGFILATSRRARVVTTNAFVESQYDAEGIPSLAQISLWVGDYWLSKDAGEGIQERPIDIVMLLRKGVMKRPDLYIELLQRLKSRENLRCTVISPDADILAQIKELASECLHRPTNDEMKELYLRSKIFLSLSDTEGFGLTALEAMGQGCVPVCRDSGGVRCYMLGAMEPNLIPREAPLEVILARIEAILGNSAELARLSTAARKVFEDGLHNSTHRREMSLEILAAELTDET